MEKKTLHIDTLYLSYNCEHEAYLEAVDIIAQKKFLYIRKGRHYYDFGFCRVGWLDWDICQKSNNYPFRIEYNFEYLYQTDLLSDCKVLQLPFQSDYNTYLISRLDYNMTFQTLQKDFLENLFVSKYFKDGSDYWSGVHVQETRNLGKRTTGKTFRIYNKSKELNDKKDFIKCDMLKQTFGSLNNLISAEVELTRKYLLSRTQSKGTLSDFDEVVTIAKHLLGSIRYCKNSKKNLALMRSKNYDKVKFTYLDKFTADLHFVKVKKYVRSWDNLIQTISNVIQQYNKADDTDIVLFKDVAKEISLIRREEEQHSLDMMMKYLKYMDEIRD